MCIPLGAIGHLIIMAIIVIAVIAILQVLLGWLAPKAGPWFSEIAAVLAQILRIILWAAVAIAVVILVFNLLACLVSGGIGLPRF